MKGKILLRDLGLTVLILLVSCTLSGFMKDHLTVQDYGDGFHPDQRPDHTERNWKV